MSSTTTNAITPAGDDLLQQAVTAYLAGLSPNTQANYASRIRSFLEWRAGQPPAAVIAHLKAYMAYLQGRGLAARTVQAHITTLKGLVRTAAALDPRLAPFLPQLDLVSPPKRRGQQVGVRLSAGQVQQLLAAPDTATVRGLRDVCILALMAICGLRRAEVSSLAWRHLWIVDGHPVIKDLLSKHGRVRTVKLPPELWERIYEWGSLSGVEFANDDPVFRPLHKSGEVLDRKRLSDDAIYEMVKAYAARAGLPAITPHDLRRTAAALARKGGATIEQVQVMLGHASSTTTSGYIGAGYNLDDHAVDYVPVEIPGPNS